MRNAQWNGMHAKCFYYISDNGDGTVDIYIPVSANYYPLPEGPIEYDAMFSVVRGVIPWPEMEDDIRERYDSWIDSGERIAW